MITDFAGEQQDMDLITTFPVWNDPAIPPVIPILENIEIQGASSNDTGLVGTTDGPE